MSVYIRFHGNDVQYDYIKFTRSDPYDEERVQSYDRMLHEALSKIFRERSLSSDQIKELLRAPNEHTRRDQTSIFELLVEQEPALEKIFPERKPSLPWIAILCNYQNSAELLVSSGADVNERVESQASFALSSITTLLNAAIRMYPSSWNDRLVALLVEHGADLKARDSENKTALHWAAYQGRVRVTKLLLEKGVDVNVTDNEGWTPLLDAAGTREADQLLPLLMKHGADVTARYDGWNALHCLARGRSEGEACADAARVLIEKGVPVDGRVHNSFFSWFNCQEHPMYLAIQNEKNELVKLFLDSGVKVNKRTNGYFLFSCVARQDNPAVLLTLLKRGANIDLKSKGGRTALHLACHGRKDEHIKILLDVGADVYVKNRRGQTPLHMLLSREFPTTLKKLALKKVCLPPSIQRKEKRIIMEKHSEQWDYYQNCIEHVDRMRVTKFIETCTFFELLTKCQCQIADLMRHRQFESNFRQFDLSTFPIYTEDILEAFERAEKLYRSMLEQEEVINEAVGNILPDTVVWKVVRYVFHCEMCELKRIVHASRGKYRQSKAARLLSRTQCTCL